MNKKKYSLSVFKIIDVIYNCQYFTKNEILYLIYIYDSFRNCASICFGTFTA